MSAAKHGGPAFPGQQFYQGHDETPPVMAGQFQGGMSLRDYFAAKAMQAQIMKVGIESDADGFFDGAIQNDIANCSYIYADAMLDAREKEQS